MAGELTTEWFAPEPREVSVRTIRGDYLAVAPRVTAPQWVEGDEPGSVVPGPALATDNVAQMMDTPAASGDGLGAGLWGLTFNNNINVVRWGPGWAGLFASQAEMQIGSIPIVDDDFGTFAAQQEITGEIVDEWRTQHPNLSYRGIEWEEASTPDNPRLFGTHTNRRLRIEHWKQSGEQAQYVAIDLGPPSPLNPMPGMGDYEPTHGIARIFVPPGQGGPIRGTYTQSGPVSARQYSTNITESLALSPTEAESGLTFGDLPGGGTLETPLIAELPISDELFDANAYALEHVTDPWRRSRGMVVWVIPYVDSMWMAERVFSYMQDAVTEVISTYTPSRFRIRYERLVDPILRTYPRDDALAGGAAQTYPTSTSMQSSNRTSGGYL